ncbi:MAG: Holliday junction resolvase [Candidatus Methanoplasma sp.]|jgi:Holliday junction resolvase|nr:Holliday junction resolvase [Candidatus Methanoplasma sp.]
MAAPGDTYERELKSLLTGERKAVSKMVKTCDAQESASYGSIEGNPFLVIRAAGSHGVDLVALRWDFSFPIEVKSSSEDVMHFSKSARLIEQGDRMLETCRMSMLAPIYAFRLKGVRGDPWRMFTMPMASAPRGSSEALWRRLPKLEVTAGGNYVMRWADGMKLSEFVHFMEAHSAVSDGIREEGRGPGEASPDC